MKHNILLLFCITLFATAYSQVQVEQSATPDAFNQFHKSIIQAERLFRNDSLLQAYGKYKFAIDNYQNTIHFSHYLKLAVSALKIKEELQSLKYLEKAVIGGFYIDTMYHRIFKYETPNTKAAFEANYTKWNEKLLTRRNAEFENRIYWINNEFKKFEKPNYIKAVEYFTACEIKSENCKAGTPDYVANKKLMSEKKANDSTLLAELIININQFQFPDESAVNSETYKLLLNFILNYKFDYDNSILNSILYKALLNGKISPAFYASVIDKRLMTLGLKPKFYQLPEAANMAAQGNANFINNVRFTIGLHPMMKFVAPSAANKKAKPGKPAIVKPKIDPKTKKPLPPEPESYNVSIYLKKFYAPMSLYNY